MKLIIDIDDNKYNRLMNMPMVSSVNEAVIKAVKNGTPLDEQLKDIRAKIDSHCSDNRDRNDGLYIAMKIIDQHIGERSEDAT